MKFITWSFSLLLLILFSVSGCATGRNSLQGWKTVQKAHEGCPFHKLVCDDCKRYIDKLSSEQKTLGLNISFQEDGSGRHAVVISNVWKEGWVFNSTYDHVLIYDKSNKRIKVIKYRTGKFMC